MKTVFLILAEDKGLAKTIVSLEENSVRPDKYVLMITKDTSEENKNIAKSLSGSCCGKEAQSYTIDNYEISTKENFSVIKIADKVEGLNYITSNLLEDSDIIFTATSGEVFDSQYVQRILSSFEDDNVGLVYTDYLIDGIGVHLQYVQPMLATSIDVKEIAARRSSLTGKPYKKSMFEFVMSIFSSAIIRHIPEELYAI